MRIQLNVYGQWIIVLGTNAWSGSAWVPVTAAGLPEGDDTIATFDSRDDAAATVLLLDYRERHKVTA